MPRKARKVPWLDWRDGIAYANWYDPATLRTKRLSLRSSDPGEAQARFAAFLAEGTEAYAPAASNRSVDISLAAALEFYFNEHRRNTVRGQLDFPSQKGHLLRVFGPTMVFKDIDKQNSKAYADQRRAEGASEGTIRNELVSVVAASNWLLENKDPDTKLKRLKPEDAPVVALPGRSDPRDRWLTHGELQTLRAAAIPDVRDFIDLCYWTLSRKTAIITMTKFQVDVDQRRIRLAKPKERKTTKRRPIVPIAPELLPVVERLMRETPGANLLPTRDYTYGFQEAVKNAKLADVTPHTLRHTGITHRLQQGVNPWVVGGMAGLTLQTLTTVYGHHCPDFMAEAIKAGLTGENPGA